METLALKNRILQIPNSLQASLVDWDSLSDIEKTKLKSDVLFDAYKPNMKLQVAIGIFSFLLSSQRQFFSEKQNTEIAGAFFGGGTGYFAIEFLKDLLAVDYNAHPLEESLVAAFGGYLATNTLLETEVGKEYADKHQQILQAFNLFVIGAYGLPIVLRAAMSGRFDELYK